MQRCIFLLGFVVFSSSAFGASYLSCAKRLVAQDLLALARSRTLTPGELDVWADGESPAETFPEGQDGSIHARWVKEQVWRRLQAYFVRPVLEGVPRYTSEDMENGLGDAKEKLKGVNRWLRREIRRVLPVARELESVSDSPVAQLATDIWGGQSLDWLATSDVLKPVYDGKTLVVPAPEYFFTRQARNVQYPPGSLSAPWYTSEPHLVDALPKGPLRLFFSPSGKEKREVVFRDRELQNVSLLQLVALGNSEFLLAACPPFDRSVLTVGIFTTRRSGSIRLAKKATFKIPGLFEKIVFSREEQAMALLMRRQAPWLFQLPDLEQYWAVSQVGKSPESYDGAFFSQDGSRLVTVSSAGWVEVVDSNSLQVSARYQMDPSDTQKLEIQSVGKQDRWVLVYRGKKQMAVLDLSSREPSFQWLASSGSGWRILSAASHPMTGRLAVLEHNHQRYRIQLWDSHQVRRRTVFEPGETISFEWDTDGDSRSYRVFVRGELLIGSNGRDEQFNPEERWHCDPGVHTGSVQ